MLRLQKQFLVKVFSAPELEEPDQRQLYTDDCSSIQHEKVRSLVLAASLLVLLCGLLCFLLVHTVTPLLVTIVLVFCGYQALDIYVRALEASAPHMTLPQK